MAIELPAAIADYFEADRAPSADGIAACFTQGAQVRDEGETYIGLDAIRRWKQESSAKYSYTVAPFAIAQDASRIVVTSHLAGDFPGSPTDLRYFFVLDGGKIAQLEVMP